MFGYIDNYNFKEMEVMRYYSHPKSYKGDPKEEAKNENIDEWVETICENKNNTIKREEQYKNIEKAKFDIKENAKQLIILYKEMYNGENL